MRISREETPSPDPDTESADGRRLRRERNRLAVVEAVIEMFQEDMLVPTIERAAERSGLSLRSVYRYFPDPPALLHAATEQMLARAGEIAHLPHIGLGAFDRRLADFTVMRLRLYEQVGQTFRATVHHAPNHVGVRENLARSRRMLTEQLERQFQPEIAALPAGVRAWRTIGADAASQLDAIDFLRRYRALTVAESTEVLATTLHRAFID
jgi:AcrR family transcriptional regulator